MAKKDLKKLAEPLLNSTLKDANYGQLKKYALDLEIDLKSLKKLNENNLRKAIKEKLSSQPVKNFPGGSMVAGNTGNEKPLKQPSAKYVVMDKIPAKKSAPASTVVPYNELDKSLTFKINHAFHHGVPKDEVIKTLNITPKRYVDVTWLYVNAGYKQKIEDFLASEQSKS